MRGGHHAHVQRYAVLAAQTLAFLVLQNVQQLGLQPHIHVADLVEQNGAALGQLEFAGLAAKSAGERAALVAE